VILDHSYVRAKKKMMVEKEDYRAKKCLWHAFRVVEFGMQVWFVCFFRFQNSVSVSVSDWDWDWDWDWNLIFGIGSGFGIV
jgi:hypothetical protein